MEREVKKEAERRGMTPEGLTQQALMEALIAGLKNQRVPQSLDELKPRRLPSPGKTAMQMVVEQWPCDDEDDDMSDEEVLRVLKAMG